MWSRGGAGRGGFVLAIEVGKGACSTHLCDEVSMPTPHVRPPTVRSSSSGSTGNVSPNGFSVWVIWRWHLHTISMLQHKTCNVGLKRFQVPLALSTWHWSRV